MKILSRPTESGEWPPQDDVDEVLACGPGVHWQAAFRLPVRLASGSRHWSWEWSDGTPVWDDMHGKGSGYATHWRTLPPDPSEQPTDGGIGARNAGRPVETQE